MSFKLIKYCLAFLISSRATFILFASLAPLVIAAKSGYLGINLNPNQDSFLFWAWANFDGKHYLSIAQIGYQKFDFAFFPFYSILIILLGHILTWDHLYIGILISNLALFGAMIFTFKITILDYKENIAILALFFLSFFPVSFFYHSVYADSLFLLLSTSCFYFARKKNWILAGAIGGLATLTRLSGLSLIPALAAEWYLQNKQVINKQFILTFFKKATIPLILVSTGFVAYAYYLQINYSDWLLFQKSMIAWQQERFVTPPQVFFRYLKILFTVSPSLIEYWIAALECFSLIAYLLLAVYVWIKVRISYGMFMVILILLVTFTGTFSGTPRYALHLFPIFIGLALLTSKNKLLKILLIIFFLILGFTTTALFTRGYFVS